MRTLALGTLLFCGLAAVLGYVATSGVAMRTTDFSRAVVANIPVPPKKTVAPVPEVEIEATPIRPSEPPAAKSSQAKPVVSKPASVHVSKRTLPVHAAAATRPTPKQNLARQAVAMTTAQPRVNHTTTKTAEPGRSVRMQQLNFTVEAQPPLHDESQDMQRDRDAQRQWREQTLARWREQERQKAEASHDSRDDRPERSLESTPVGGLYKAEPEKKPKKRHRFLFIRW